MKNIIYLLLAAAVLMTFNSCEDEFDPIQIVNPSEDGISFLNSSFSTQYLLSEDTEDNIAERFIWSRADFGVPTNIKYELQATTDAQFETFNLLGTTSTTNLAITVRQLLNFALDLGLDSDPETTDSSGAPNNTGSVYFRVRGLIGEGTPNLVEMYSAIQRIDIFWIEETTEFVPGEPYYIVGDGTTANGWTFDDNVVLVETESKIRTARLAMGYGQWGSAFSFYPGKDDWSTAYGYTYYAENGYDIDPLLEDNGDGHFKFVGTEGVYQLTVNAQERTIVLEPSVPYYIVGDASTANGWTFDDTVRLPETAAYIRQAVVSLGYGQWGSGFSFFPMKDVWDTQYGYTYFSELDYTIDPLLEDNGDGHFKFVGSEGNYEITIDALNKTIVLIAQ
ncbi:SusE domain-containing protein [Aestuariivivens sediminis]|uniref:SusE domain-containing protein n=1 Tax=Aestuariivivens sediminis TaxID=2913557 RepID=UPI001F57653E|nr:SusE domain-containing protein [Aestuariivivens sediminis]